MTAAEFERSLRERNDHPPRNEREDDTAQGIRAKARRTALGTTTSSGQLGAEVSLAPYGRRRTRSRPDELRARGPQTAASGARLVVRPHRGDP